MKRFLLISLMSLLFLACPDPNRDTQVIAVATEETNPQENQNPPQNETPTDNSEEPDNPGTTPSDSQPTEPDPPVEVPEPDPIGADSLLIMVYASGDNDLHNNIKADIQEWEAYTPENSAITIIALLDGYGTLDTRCYRIEPDSSYSQISSPRLSIPELSLYANTPRELNMGDPNTLKTFVNFSMTNYPAEASALIISGHGDGWFIDQNSSNRAISPDYTDGGRIDPIELNQALQGVSLNVLSLDACAMGAMEVVCQLKDRADYIIAAPSVIPSQGYRNDFLYKELDQNVPYTDSRKLAQCFVDSYNQSYYGSPTAPIYGYDTKAIFQEITSQELTQDITELYQKLSLFDQQPDQQNSWLLSQRSYTVSGTQSYLNIQELLPRFYQLIEPSMLIASPHNNEPVAPGAISVYFPLESSNLRDSYFDSLIFQRSTGWQDFLWWFHKR